MFFRSQDKKSKKSIIALEDQLKFLQSNLEEMDFHFIFSQIQTKIGIEKINFISNSNHSKSHTKTEKFNQNNYLTNIC